MDNVDWEDIAKDDTDLYIADIGNNHGNRKDLTVYKIPLDGLKNTNAPTTKMIINYPDQKSFKYGNQDHPYDAESIVAIDDHLYVFSKDWKDLTTVVYQFNKNGARQNAKTITTHNVKGLITGATYNGRNKLMLCGYNSFLMPFVIPVTYNTGAFEFGEKYELPLSNGAQVEAITYRGLDENGNEVYYLSSEAVNIKLGEDEAKTNAELYKLIWTDK